MDLNENRIFGSSLVVQWFNPWSGNLNPTCSEVQPEKKKGIEFASFPILFLMSSY